MSALRFELKPSPALAAGIVLLHLGASFSALACLPGLGGSLLAAAFAALGAAAAWSRALLRAPSSVRAIEVDGARLVLELRNGRILPAQAAARRYVTRWLVAVPPAGARGPTLLVTAGMLEGRSFRLLRLWALWGRLPGAVAVESVAGKQLPA